MILLYLFWPIALAVLVFIFWKRRRVSSALSIIYSIICIIHIEKVTRSPGYMFPVAHIIYPYICIAVFVILFTNEWLVWFLKKRKYRGWWVAIFILPALLLGLSLYDAYTVLQEKQNLAFWEKVIETGEGTPEKCVKYMTPSAIGDLERILLWGAITDNIRTPWLKRRMLPFTPLYRVHNSRSLKVDNPQSIDIIIGASIIRNQESLLAAASTRRSLTEEQCKVLNDWAEKNPQSQYANVIRSNVSKIMERMRKAQQPIPMYAKELFIELPDGDGDFAYDFFQGDLVSPQGKGVVTDVVFRVETTISEKHKIKGLKGEMLFPDNNGIQVIYSDENLKNHPLDRKLGILPFHAPETGYLSTLAEARGDAQNIRGYFIKVRATDDGEGCYGMITTNVEFADWGRPCIKFTYYLNPDKTTNLEYNGTYIMPYSGKYERYPRAQLW